MNNLEVVRGTNGKIKSVKIDGVPLHAQTLIVEDDTGGVSKVTIIMDAVVTGHTE